MRQEKLRNIGRVVHCHQWATLEEWVQSLDHLADLTESEIEEAEKLAAEE